MATQLTIEEIKQIERNAVDAAKESPYQHHNNGYVIGYEDAATAYAIKAKVLVEALERIEKRCIGKYITASYVKEIVKQALSSYNNKQ